MRRTSGRVGQDRSLTVEVLPGIESFAARELTAVRGVSQVTEGRRSGELRCLYRGELAGLAHLRTVVAVYLTETYDVPRPKSLLGDQDFRSLLRQLGQVLGQGAGFESFRFSAAGSDSPAIKRLAGAIQAATGLAYAPETGSLVIRLRGSSEQRGWEVLVRLTRRPLSARPWRVCNVPGGLNATVAAAMLMLGGMHAGQRVLNAMCGSGTLLVERHALGPTERLVGVDNAPEAVDCARQNIRAAGAHGVELLCADVTQTELKEQFDLIVADLPWGDAVGTRATNVELYPEFLVAAARVSTDAGRLVVLTHDIRVFESALRQQSVWRPSFEARVYHGGHHPRIYLLER